LLLAGTPVLARPRINPASPGLDTPPPVVMPNGAYVGQPILVVPWRDNCKNTGAASPTRLGTHLERRQRAKGFKTRSPGEVYLTDS
jgi:hypothetical protein